MHIGSLYHWSPADRRPSITLNGLVPGSPNVVCTVPYPFICLAPDPHQAWQLSGAVAEAIGGYVSPTGWDLWQITVADTDEVHVRAEFGPHIHEVQVRNRITPDRVTYLATRLTTSA